MGNKDILIVRTPNQIVISDDVVKNIVDKFVNIYNVLVIGGENDTDKTTFEIIKY